MKTQADKSTYLPLLLTGIAIILFSTAGIARVMGWSPNPTGASSDTVALDQTADVSATSESRARPRCPACGVVVSMREIERHGEDIGPGAGGGATAGDGDETGLKTNGSYEITVRLVDGSSRMFVDANPARWRTGERVIVIDGANPSHR
jgi:hypothetical protein